MSAVKSFRDRKGMDSINAKLDAIMEHLKLTLPTPEYAPLEEGIVDKEGETGGVQQVRPEQVAVPAKVSDIPDLRQKTGPAEGGRANGEKPHLKQPMDAKDPKFPPGVTDQTKVSVMGELQDKEMQRQADAKKVEAKEPEKK